MEPLDNTQPDKEPSPEQLNQLLKDSYNWITKIVEDHHTDENIHAANVSATTREAERNNKLGHVFVEDLDGNRKVTINENSLTDSQDSTTERYELSYTSGTGEYELFTSGVQQPDVTGDIELHPATPAETQRLAFILEDGAFGHIPLNFRRDAIKLRRDLDGLNES